MSQKITDLPGSNDQQANSKRTRNYEAHDTGGNRPNMEQVMGNEDKGKQAPKTTTIWRIKARPNLPTSVVATDTPATVAAGSSNND